MIFIMQHVCTEKLLNGCLYEDGVLKEQSPLLCPPLFVCVQGVTKNIFGKIFGSFTEHNNGNRCKFVCISKRKLMFPKVTDFYGIVVILME